MEIILVLRNYRCFTDSKPAYFSIKPGLTSIIGVNNSGKSTILKFFYEFRSIFQNLQHAPHIITALSPNGLVFSPPNTLKSSDDYFCNSNDRHIEMQFSCKEDYEGELVDFDPFPENISILVRRNENIARLTIRHRNGSFLTFSDKLGNENGVLTMSGSAITNISIFLSIFKILSKTLYIGSFRNAVNIGGSGQYFDIEIGEEFIRRWSTLKNGNNKSQSQITYQLCDDIKNIFGYKSFDVNASDDKKSLKVLVDSKIYDISELGAGLAQFIIVFINAAISAPAFILIDEPELNLHPTLQIDFITSLARYSSNGLMFSTHSIGLARSVSDQTFSTRRTTPENCEIKPYEELKNMVEFLGELSYSSYVDIGSNKILLVEGKHDIKVFQQLLRKMKKDHEVVILPLRGSESINEAAIYQLNEIVRLSQNVYAIIDSEKKSESEILSAQRQGFKASCESAGIKIKVLSRRAIENYFPDRVVKKVVGPKGLPLSPYQLLNDGKESWSKKSNWKLAAEMNIDELKSTDIYEFLNGI